MILQADATGYRKWGDKTVGGTKKVYGKLLDTVH